MAVASVAQYATLYLPEVQLTEYAWLYVKRTILGQKTSMNTNLTVTTSGANPELLDGIRFAHDVRMGKQRCAYFGRGRRTADA